MLATLGGLCTLNTVTVNRTVHRSIAQSPGEAPSVKHKHYYDVLVLALLLLAFIVHVLLASLNNLLYHKHDQLQDFTRL